MAVQLAGDFSRLGSLFADNVSTTGEPSANDAEVFVAARRLNLAVRFQPTEGVRGNLRVA